MMVFAEIRQAFSLLTAVPIQAARPNEDTAGDVAAAFPFVGLAIGVATWLALAAILLAESRFLNLVTEPAYLTRAPLVFAVLIVTAWALLSRFLHWDGLGDVADAFWGGPTVERRLEIMADSSIGAFGVTGIVIVFVLCVAALGNLLGTAEPLATGWFLVAVPVVGRLAATFAAWLGVSARPEGLGSAVMGRPSVAGAVFGVVTVAGALAPVVMLMGVSGAVWCAAMILVAAAVPHLLASRMGGVTGDVMGASILITEAIGLTLFVMAGWF